MITLLLALHPKSWRARYGEEFRALLGAEPLTAMVVLDILGNAARQQARSPGVLLRLLLTVAVSVGVESVAVTGGFTENILWSPDTAPRAVLLTILVLPWVPLTAEACGAARRQWRRRHQP